MAVIAFATLLLDSRSRTLDINDPASISLSRSMPVCIPIPFLMIGVHESSLFQKHKTRQFKNVLTTCTRRLRLPHFQQLPVHRDNHQVHSRMHRWSTPQATRMRIYLPALGHMYRESEQPAFPYRQSPVYYGLKQ